MLALESVEREGVAIIILGIIAVTAMFLLGLGAKEIVLSIGSGLVGFLSRGKSS